MGLEGSFWHALSQFVSVTMQSVFPSINPSPRALMRCICILSESIAALVTKLSCNPKRIGRAIETQSKFLFLDPIFHRCQHPSSDIIRLLISVPRLFSFIHRLGYSFLTPSLPLPQISTMIFSSYSWIKRTLHLTQNTFFHISS